MSARPDGASAAKHSVAAMTYARDVLPANKVQIFLSLAATNEIRAFDPFEKDVESLLACLKRGVAPQFQLSPFQARALRDDFVYEENGYDDQRVIEKTIPLTEEICESRTGTKDDEWNIVLIGIWKLFDMLKTFSRRYTQYPQQSAYADILQ